MSETALNTAEVQELIAEAVKAERERIRAALREEMDEVEGYWVQGLDDTARKRSFALGKMAGLHTASTRLGGNTLPVHPPTFWQTNVDHLGV